MLRTTNILIPSIVFGVVLLGLAVIFNGGLVNIQLGPDTNIRVEQGGGERP